MRFNTKIEHHNHNNDCLNETQYVTRNKKTTCFKRFKIGIKNRCLAISHGRKSTGALYINGKDYYASLSHVFISITLALIVLSSSFSAIGQLGKILSKKQS